MRRILALIMLVVSSRVALPQVVSYEADGVFPEHSGFPWERSVWCTPDRSIEAGELVERLLVGECAPPPPNGDQDDYRRSLADFVGVPDFFVEWRVVTDGDRAQLDFTSPAALVLGGMSAVGYHFTISRDQVRYIRDNFDDYEFIDITADLPHTYRLELHGANWFVWTIDGVVVDSGVPGGAFPSAATKVIAFRCKTLLSPSTTRWDYIRYGRITQPTGDSNCDGRVDNFDIDPFILAISDAEAYATAHPGCNRSNADCDGDGRVDNFDIDAFVELLGG